MAKIIVDVVSAEEAIFSGDAASSRFPVRKVNSAFCPAMCL